MSRPIVITVRLPVDTRKTENGVIATCQFLDVSCFGGTRDEALSELSGLLTSYLGSCLESGRFDQLFHGNGYSQIEPDTTPDDGRFLDIGIKLCLPAQPVAIPELPRVVPSSLLSTWMT